MKNQLSVELVTLECYFCGTPFGMSETLYQTAQRKQGHAFYCPNGHGQIFSETTDAKLAKVRDEAERLKRRLADAERWEREADERAKVAERSLAATKGQVTKLRKRIGAGVCPYCTRHFTALERHIASKHPDQPLVAEQSS